MMIHVSLTHRKFYFHNIEYCLKSQKGNGRYPKQLDHPSKNIRQSTISFSLLLSQSLFKIKHVFLCLSCLARCDLLQKLFYLKSKITIISYILIDSKHKAIIFCLLESFKVAKQAKILTELAYSCTFVIKSVLYFSNIYLFGIFP